MRMIIETRLIMRLIMILIMILFRRKWLMIWRDGYEYI